MLGQSEHVHARATMVVRRDDETDTFAAWCDELDVATSAPTAEAATEALLEAMRIAARFALRHARSAGRAFIAQLPLAEWVAQAEDAELRELVHVER